MKIVLDCGRKLGLAWLVFLLAWGAAPAATASGRKGAPVLILYDGAGSYGWLGDVHARMLANLIGHFDLPLRLMPVEQYVTGSIQQARAVFYLGLTYDNPLPAPLLEELLATTKPVCWFKYNLWQLDSGPGSAFSRRYGFQFDHLEASGYDVILYKNEILGKNQLDPELGHTTLVGTNAVIAAWACRSGSIDCMPYVVHGGNFWYVADIPFSFIGDEDRYLVICDLLHDILGIAHAEQHRALIRIEDVNARSSPASLRAVTDFLSGEAVPFLISVIPLYTDPLGHDNGGVPRTVPLVEALPLRQALHDAVRRGAQVVLHGYTHQYDSVPNPNTGASADDFEFFRVTVDGLGNFDEFMPVPADSLAWAEGRARAGLRELRRAGFSPIAWSTPHYAASAIDYAGFAALFPLTIQRAIYFEGTGNLSGVRGHGLAWLALFDSSGHYGGQFFPYVIQNDIYGQKVVPENLGNVDLPVLNGTSVRQAADMIRIARKNLVVRDGWASGFFHPFLDLAQLEELVHGIREQGYTFVRLRRDVR